MKTNTRKLLIAAVSVLIIGVTLISGCTPPTAEIIEKVVTQVITETVKETVVVEGTSQVVEKEVEKIVEVTATPDAISHRRDEGCPTESDLWFWVPGSTVRQPERHAITSIPCQCRLPANKLRQICLRSADVRQLDLR